MSRNIQGKYGTSIQLLEKYAPPEVSLMVGGGVVGVCGQNICYHAAAFRDSL